MKNIILLVIVAFALFACNNSNEKKEVTPFTCELKSPFNYENIVMYQDSCMENSSWTLEFEYDLNDDNVNEKFLGIVSYSRGMNYVLFTPKGKNWELLSGQESIPSGHLEIQVLETKKDGWHDFMAMQPSGRDGIIESYFYFDGKQYVLKEQIETTY